MSEDWNAIAKEVADGLASIGNVGTDGFEVTLTKVVNSGPDWNPTQTPTDYSLIAMDYPYEKSDRDGTVIQQSDKRLYLQADSVIPEMADTVTVSGEVFQIISIETLSPAGIAVLYEVQLRK